MRHTRRSKIVTTALGRLDDIYVCVSNVVWNMVFLVVDIDTYNLLLGLNVFMKIGAVVDEEKGTILLKHGHRADVEMLPLNVVNIVQYGETWPTFSMEHIKNLDKMFQQLQMEDVFEKGLLWKCECFSGPNYPNDEGSFDDNMTKFGSEADEEDVQVSLIVQENDVAPKDDLKDQGLNHFLQQEFTNQIVNIILQDWHYRLLEEYIIERDDYVD